MIHLAVIVLLSWLTVVVFTILNLRHIHRVERKAKPSSFPVVSVIIPARNEERLVEATVRGMLAQTYPNLEIIVVDDRSTDRTAEIVAAFADPRLRLIRGADTPAGWLGKPWALHQGAAESRGELLLFVDADVIYEPEAVSAAVAFFQSSGTSLVSLFPNLRMQGFWEHVLMPQLVVSVFCLLPVFLGRRSTSQILAIGGGPGNLVRRDVYEAAGGHEALRDAVVDDIGLVRLVRRKGHVTEFARAEDLISVRMYHGLREIIEGFTKNAFIAFGGTLLSASLLLVGMLVWHLLPFYWAARGVLQIASGRPIDTLTILGLIVVALIGLARALVFRSFGYRMDNALMGHPLMTLVWMAIILRSAWFCGVKRRLSWRGRHYDSASTRFGG